MLLPPIIFIVSITLRFLCTYFAKGFKGSDYEFHEYVINKIRSNNYKLELYKENRVTGGDNRIIYPIFYHWMLSFLPQKLDRVIEKYSPLLFDVITTIVFSFIMITYTELPSAQLYLINALFLIHPLFLFSIYSPRTYTLTPRTFSQFLFNITSLCFIIVSLETNPYIVSAFVCLIVLLIALNSLTSRFFTQYLILTAIISLFFSEYMTLIYTISSFILCAVLFNKVFYLQTKGHIENLEWFYKKQKEFYASKSLLIDQQLRNRPLFTQAKNFMVQLFLNNQFFGGIVKNPILVIFLYGSIHVSTSIQSDIIPTHILSSIIIFSITSFGMFKMIGEAQRYIEYTLLLQLFWLSFNSNLMTLTLLSLYFILLSLFALLIILRFLGKGNLDELSDALSKLQEIPKSAKVFCTEMNDFHYLLNRTTCQLVGITFLSLRSPKKDYLIEYLPRYPYLNLDKLDEILGRYDAEYIFHRKRHKYSITSQSELKLKKIFENNEYQIYKVK